MVKKIIEDQPGMIKKSTFLLIFGGRNTSSEIASQIFNTVDFLVRYKPVQIILALSIVSVILNVLNRAYKAHA